MLVSLARFEAVLNRLEVFEFETFEFENSNNVPRPNFERLIRLVNRIAFLLFKYFWFAF